MIKGRSFALRCVLLAVVAFSIIPAVTVSAKGDAELGKPERCPITRPGGNYPPGTSRDGWFGNESLSTNVWMWSDEGGIPVDAEHRSPQGGYGDFKWAWYRFVPGQLTIEGYRLDSRAAPMTAGIPDGYGNFGFIPTGLYFPTAGCWEVTGRVGNSSLTFVTLVIPPRFPVTAEGWSRGWGGTVDVAENWKW